MKPRIVVVGSSNTDMIIKVPQLPSPGETVMGGQFHMVNGGKGANQAIAAARAGGDVIFISCLGSDNFGHRALEILKKEGIDTTHIKIVDDAPSGVALINVSESGENSITVAPGANSHLFPEDIEKLKSVIINADMVLMQLEIPIETVYATIRIADAHRIPVILNPAPARVIEPEILKMVTIITPNEKEAAKLTLKNGSQIGHSDLMNGLRELGLNTIIITLGENGVFFLGNGQEGRQDGNKVNVIDTTAAGDTFNGFLAVSLASGEPLSEAVRLANNAAAISVTRLGASTSIPFLAEVQG